MYMLRRLKLSTVPATTTPLNKGAIVCCFFYLVVLAMLYLPLAGHGGGGVGGEDGQGSAVWC
jgi:hypothetical protein